MGEIKTSNKQITVFYNSNSRIAKQTLAYAKTEGLPIQEIDILNTPLTGTQIAELANKLNVQVKDLVNQKHHDYHHKFNHHNLSEIDWITMIKNNPEILKQPIALKGDSTILIETPTDIIKI